jgi:hypothetical protein
MRSTVTALALAAGGGGEAACTSVPDAAKKMAIAMEAQTAFICLPASFMGGSENRFTACAFSRPCSGAWPAVSSDCRPE